MSIKSLFSITVICLSATLTSQAQSNPQSAEPEAIHWPSTPRPNVEVSHVQTNFDGIPVPIIQIQLEELKFELANRKTLASQGTSSPRYSGEFTDERLPGVTIGMSVFKRGEFLADLSEESWSSYKRGLALDTPNLSIVLDNTNIGAAITPYVFGKEFRQIAYEQESGNLTVKRREIFAFIGSNLFVFTISGTKAMVDQNWVQVDHLIGEMNML